MLKRDRAYYRWQRKRTIKRKLALLKRIGGDEYVQAWTHGKPGRLTKGKIHCSCPMCRVKSYDNISNQDAKGNESTVQQMLDCQFIVLHK